MDRGSVEVLGKAVGRGYGCIPQDAADMRLERAEVWVHFRTLVRMAMVVLLVRILVGCA